MRRGRGHWQMPTVLWAEGYRFFFFSNEGHEPPHVHVRRGGGLAKFWLAPVSMEHASGLSPAELRRARELVHKYAEAFLEKGNEHPYR